MSEKDQQALLLKEIQVRLDRKLKEQEISLLEYWKAQIDRITASRPEGIAALQQQARAISDMMANRIRILKREKEQ
jgi:hypothetical protein